MHSSHAAAATVSVHRCAAQDTRGRLTSQGEFVPFEHERGDGAASVAWVRQQPWCDGRVAVYGPSYLGLTTWACVGGCGDGELQAAIPVIAQSRVFPAIFQGSDAEAAPNGGEAKGGAAEGAAEGGEAKGGAAEGGATEGGATEGGVAEGVEAGGGFSLELCVLWLYLVFTLLQPALMRSRLALCRTLYRDWRARRLERACLAAPLERIDELLLGSKARLALAQRAPPSAPPSCAPRPSPCALAQQSSPSGLPANPGLAAPAPTPTLAPGPGSEPAPTPSPNQVSFVQEALASPHADAPCWRAPSSLLCDLPGPPPTRPLTSTLTSTPTPLTVWMPRVRRPSWRISPRAPPRAQPSGCGAPKMSRAGVRATPWPLDPNLQP